MNGRTEPQTRTSLLYQQARRHHQLGEFGEAVTLYGQVMKARPRHTPTLLYLSEIAWQTGNLDQAVVLLTRAIAVDPQYVAGYDLLWQVYKARGEYESAVRVLRRLIEIRRHDGHHYYHLAQLQHELGNQAEAQQLFEQAIRYKPDDGQIFAHYGDLLQAMGQIENAAAQYRQALMHDPRNAGYHSRFGYLLTLCGQTQEGLTQMDRSVLLDPRNAALQQQRWQTLLQTGDLPAGFAAAARNGGIGDRTVVNPTYRTIPQWKGETFPGRLLIHAEADIADVLQFARYLPLVKAKVGALILAIPKSLQKLFSNLHCIDEIVDTTSDGLGVARAEQRLPVAMLPLVFDTTLDTIPAHTPYLFADPFLTHSWVRRLNWQSYRVGLVWEKGAANIEPLLNLPGISWYNLRNDSNDRDYADTAALAANLDLIIAVDSPEAHLAAAIGRSVWTLLPFEANWRWLHRREDSPWYPTMRLFRQSQPGDWDTVLQRVADALGPQSRPFRQFQPLQGKPREFFAETAVTY